MTFGETDGGVGVSLSSVVDDVGIVRASSWGTAASPWAWRGSSSYLSDPEVVLPSYLSAGASVLVQRANLHRENDGGACYTAGESLGSQYLLQGTALPRFPGDPPDATDPLAAGGGVTLEFEVAVTSNKAIVGVVFGFTNDDSYLRLISNSAQDCVRLDMNNNGVWSDIEVIPGRALPKDEWAGVRLIIKADETVDIFVNDARLPGFPLSLADLPVSPLAGFLGLYSGGTSDISGPSQPPTYFDNVTVFRPSVRLCVSSDPNRQPCATQLPDDTVCVPTEDIYFLPNGTAGVGDPPTAPPTTPSPGGDGGGDGSGPGGDGGTGDGGGEGEGEEDGDGDRGGVGGADDDEDDDGYNLPRSAADLSDAEVAAVTLVVFALCFIFCMVCCVYSLWKRNKSLESRFDATLKKQAEVAAYTATAKATAGMGGGALPRARSSKKKKRSTGSDGGALSPRRSSRHKHSDNNRVEMTAVEEFEALSDSESEVIA